jgi:hypothetical protein
VNAPRRNFEENVGLRIGAASVTARYKKSGKEYTKAFSYNGNKEAALAKARQWRQEQIVEVDSQPVLPPEEIQKLQRKFHKLVSQK